MKNKNEKKLTYIKDALNYYSLNYNKFTVHNKNGKIFDIIDNSNICGRITSQGLNEAMISIQVVNCINNIDL